MAHLTAEASSKPSEPNPELSDSLLRRLVLNPLFFVSFLLSLLWIDSRNYASTHKSDRRPSLIIRLSSWDRRRTSRQEGNRYWQAKQRKMAKMEIGDALDMRAWMLGVCALGTLVALGSSWLVARWVWGMVVG